MAKSEYAEFCDNSSLGQPTPLEKKPTEAELHETLRWRRLMIAKYIMLIMFLQVARGDLVETPLNEAVLVGNDPVEFKCKSDLGHRLKWWTQQSQSKLILFNGYSISEEAESFCNVENKVPGEFYLNLTAIHEAAKTYICHEPATNKESSADLIVIEREAQCETDANNSHVIIICDLEFRGNWAPELEWSYNGTLITQGVNSSIMSNKSVSSTLTVPCSENSRNYICTTRFDMRGKPPWTTSDNIPDYVSHSVLTVEANQVFAVKPEAHFSAGEKSVVGLAIGLATAITVIVVIIVFIFVRKVIFNKRERKKAKAAKRSSNEEAAEDVGEPLTA